MIVTFVPFFLKILEERFVEDQKQALLLLAQNERAIIHQNYKEALNIITQVLRILKCIPTRIKELEYSIDFDCLENAFKDRNIREKLLYKE